MMKVVDVDAPFNSYLTFEERKNHFTKHPIFCLLSQESINKLALLAEEIHIKPNEVIVSQGDRYEAFFLIVEGKADVSRHLKRIQKTNSKHILNLEAGQAIGLGEAGLHSPSGIRTATVTALSSMILLRVELYAFYQFLREHTHIYPSLKNMSEKILLLSFLSQSQLFKRLPIQQYKKMKQKVKHTYENLVNNSNSINSININRVTGKTYTGKKIPDISHLEQVIFTLNNDKNKQVSFIKNELNNKDIYLIMLKLQSLGFMDFDLMYNPYQRASIFKKVIGKVATYWKG